MLTCEEIKAMSDEEAQVRFQAACVDLFGDRWKTAFAREVDMSPRQVNFWQEQGNRPPVWAIMLAEALAHSRQIASTLKSLDMALTVIRDLAGR